MNRNEMYRYLEEQGMYHIRKWRDKKKYHVEFRLNRDTEQHECIIITDWGYISDVQFIELFAKEVHIEGNLSDLSININYKDMKHFEVRLFDEEGVRVN